MSGRIRSIKPEVLEDEIASGLTDEAWRLWVSCWVLADDHGDVRASEKYLAASVWQDTTRNVSRPLQELIDKGRFHPYAVEGQRYVRIHAWDKHQRIDNRGRPRIPTPEQDDGTWDQGLTNGLAASRRESPQPSASLGGSPLRAYTRPRNPAARPAIPITIPISISTSGPAANLGELATSDTKKRRRIPDDWQPSAETIRWAAEKHGVDAEACVEEFRTHWLGEGAVKARWDQTFRNRILKLLELGKAPMLPPDDYTPQPLPVGDPAQAAQVAELLSGVAKARVVGDLATTGGRNHG